MSLQKTKCDAELGYKIEEYLREKGVNTLFLRKMNLKLSVLKSISMLL